MPSRGSSRRGGRAESLVDTWVKKPTGPLDKKYAQDLADWLGDWVAKECEKGLFSYKSLLKFAEWTFDFSRFKVWLEAEEAEASARRLEKEGNRLMEAVVVLSSALIKGEQLLSSENPEFGLLLRAMGETTLTAFDNAHINAGLLRNTLMGIALSGNHPSRGEAASAAAQLPQGSQNVSKIDWRGVQRQLLQMHDRNEAYTGLRALGGKLNCSPATARKAIEKSGTLSRWQNARQEKGPPRATGLGRVHTDNVPQDREPDPALAAEANEAKEAEETLHRLIEEADPQVRAWLNKIPREEVHKMTPDGVREMIKMLKNNTKDAHRVLGRKP